MSLDTINQNIFGLTALVVSLVALVTTVLQVLQQYYSDAAGYRRCTDSVIGLWYKGTHRRVRWREFRFEVIFETPVLFLASPTNIRGPIPGRDIHYLTGTAESYHKTRVRDEDAQRVADGKIFRIGTTDDERASWVNLLTTLQRAEKESRHWDEQQRTMAPPKVPGNAIRPPKYSLVVGLQRKKRSWDFMPSSMTKPYATTAICHLVEMAALTGIYWKLFDSNRWNLRAEGNGFILTATEVDGLGVLVIFSIIGRSSFTQNRAIPCNEVKQYAFGTVPNIFEDKEYLDREEDAQSLDLVFGAKDEIVMTLESLGCSSDALRHYENDHKHIFSIDFEIIGMLAKVMRLRGSCFSRLPNPSSDAFVKQVGRKAAWSIARIMLVFQERLAKVADANKNLTPEHAISTIMTHWQQISTFGCDDEATLTIEAREAIHDAIDSVDGYLLALPQVLVLSVVVAHVETVLTILAMPKSLLHTLFLANKELSLMNCYFDVVLPRIGAADTLGVSSASATSPTKASTTAVPRTANSPPAVDTSNSPLAVETSPAQFLAAETATTPTLIIDSDPHGRSAVWFALVFRMLCWLLIHDFDRADTKIVPAALMGSRMPVYIG